MSHGFPRDSRIRRGPELQRVLKEGKRMRTRFLDVRVCTSPLERSAGRRVGIIVPKAKHTGVDRNKLKRRLRELTRLILLNATQNDEIVLIARNDTYRADFSELRTDVERIVRLLPVGDTS